MQQNKDDILQSGSVELSLWLSDQVGVDEVRKIVVGNTFTTPKNEPDIQVKNSVTTVDRAQEREAAAGGGNKTAIVQGRVSGRTAMGVWLDILQRSAGLFIAHSSEAVQKLRGGDSTKGETRGEMPTKRQSPSRSGPSSPLGRLNFLVIALAMTAVPVRGGIDIWVDHLCYCGQGPDVGCNTNCESSVYALEWGSSSCKRLINSGGWPLQPQDMAYGGFPGKMSAYGVCGDNLDFYNTGNGYDVYKSGGDGTKMGHCNWQGDHPYCVVPLGGAQFQKYYSCDISTCR